MSNLCRFCLSETHILLNCPVEEYMSGQNKKQLKDKPVFDPVGKNQHELGAKLDGGKLRPFLVYDGFKNALMEVIKAGTFGSIKYTDYGWESVPNARMRYLDAAFRHFNKRMVDQEIYDEESGVHHLGAMVWNILAVCELELRELFNKEK